MSPPTAKIESGQRLDRGIQPELWRAGRVTHQIPEYVFIYHAKTDTYDTLPDLQLHAKQLTHPLVIKPTHMIGGYAQLSYGSTIRADREPARRITVVRRRSQQVQY